MADTSKKFAGPFFVPFPLVPFLLLLFLLLFVLPGCAKQPETPNVQTAVGTLFREVTADVGLQFRHHPGATDDFPMPQSMGSGCALIDVNGDGLLDILIVPGEAAEQSDPAAARHCTLLLQQSDGQFCDVSSEAGLTINAFGMGAAAADMDNDGDIDIIITTLHGASLFLNDGSGRFQDVTATAGIATSRWTTAAAFFDYDRDGWLDLMIVNYVDYVPGSICEDGTGRRDYCGPLAFQGTVDRLYRNRGGDGQLATFEDVTIASGLITATGKGLGLICSDLTGDGLPDIYVANDSEPNRIWVQQTSGTFRDEAELRGCAVDVHARPQASMGTVWADMDGDGLRDVFLTHLRGETNTLYRQITAGVFVDQTAAARLGQPSLNFTGFGTAAVDIDLDGHPDLLIANGKVMRSALLNPGPASSHWEDYAERNQIFLGRPDFQFEDRTQIEEPFCQLIEVSRGLAVGDIDNDGALDVLVNNTGSSARLYRNVAERKGHWLMVRAIDPAVRRDAIGARIQVICGDQSWLGEVQPNLGYLSCHDVRVHFGIGPSSGYDSIVVQWPHGEGIHERFDGGPANQQVTLIRGTGTLLPADGHDVQP